jgi:hypothetical protein
MAGGRLFLFREHKQGLVLKTSSFKHNVFLNFSLFLGVPAFSTSTALMLSRRRYCNVVSVTVDGVWIGTQIFWTAIELVTINNYDNPTQLHITKITVTTAPIKSFQFSLAVAW